jgi:O-antigen ligase
MSSEPRSAGSITREARARAREQARPLPAVGLAVAAVVIAVVLVLGFVVLDYHFEQASRRLVKMLVGGAGIVSISLFPYVGLVLLPVATPLLGLLPKLPVPGMNTLNIMVFSIFFSFALTQVLQRRPLMRKGMLTVPIAVLIGIAAISIVRGAAFPTGHTYDAAGAGLTLFRAAMSFAAYGVVLAMARGERDRRRLTLAVLAGFALETMFTLRMGRDLHGRSTGTFGQSNELGTYLAMSAVFALAMGFGVRAWWGRMMMWGLSGLGMIAVLMTVSRGAMVALVAGVLVVAVRTSRVLVAAVLLLAATSPLWAPDYVKERIAATATEGDESDDTVLEAGTESRLNTWQTIMHITEEHLLDGIGFDGLGFVLPQLGEQMGLRVKDSSHNTFLRLLAETGIAGLIAFLVLLWCCWRLSIQGARAAANRFDRQIAVGMGGMAVALGLSCWFGDRFWEIMITGNFWLLCALTDGIVRERRVTVTTRDPAGRSRSRRWFTAPPDIQPREAR